MPKHVKIIFSLVVLAIAFAGYLFLDSLGQHGPKYAALFVGVFSVASFWIFPEVSHKKGKDK